MKTYLAKIRLTPTETQVYFPTGDIQGVTATIADTNVLRLNHPVFQEGTTFCFPVLIEQSDIELSMMATVGEGICDIYCYNKNGSRANNFYFQIKIEVYN